MYIYMYICVVLLRVCVFVMSGNGHSSLCVHCVWCIPVMCVCAPHVPYYVFNVLLRVECPLHEVRVSLYMMCMPSSYV